MRNHDQTANVVSHIETQQDTVTDRTILTAIAPTGRKWRVEAPSAASAKAGLAAAVRADDYVIAN